MILRLKEILKEKKISQKDLAAKTGLTAVTINNIVLNGNPTIETLQKIADALELNIIELFNVDTDASEKISIYVKDDNGNEITIGYLKSKDDLIKSIPENDKRDAVSEALSKLRNK